MAQDDVDATHAAGAREVSWWARGWAWCVHRWVRLAVLGGLVVVAAAVVGWVRVPELYVGVRDEAARTQATVTTRASVLAVLAGLGALVTIAINYRNSRTQLETLATTQKTFRVTERGHLTDRYAKAIEQLGNEDSIAIRLGGIYGLQQLAVDTDRDSDQAAVVEVLSAFVRLNLEAGLPGVVARDVVTQERYDVARNVVASVEPRADVLAAISVLAQLPTRDGVPMRADFRGLNFTGIKLSNARLSSADLARVDLVGADLSDALLTEADLSDTNLAGALLTQVDLGGANLASALLTGADLSDAGLYGADLRRVYLVDATLTNTSLTNADLTGALGTEGLSEEQLASVRRRPDGSPGTPETESEGDRD